MAPTGVMQVSTVTTTKSDSAREPKPPGAAPASKRQSWRWWVGGALGAIVVLAIMILTVISFKTSSHVYTDADAGDLPNGIGVHANVIKVLPAEDHLVVELSFEPVGSFARGEHFLSEPVRIEVTGGTDARDLTFSAGELMTPLNLNAALGNGDISDYPFDGYETVIHVHVLDDVGQVVLSTLVAEALVHGYRVTLEGPDRQPNGSNELIIKINRAPSTLFFAMFVMFLMWSLTGLALALAIKEIRSGRRIDLELIALFGVLLFAFPAVRGSVPNSPALGVLGDFLAYFWCEIALGLGLVALLATKLLRRHG